MIAESKLTFVAWTGLGITALFGGTGIYLVRNSQSLEKGKEEPKPDLEEDSKSALKEPVAVLDSSSQPDPASKLVQKEQNPEQGEELGPSLEPETSEAQSLEESDFKEEEQVTSSKPALEEDPLPTAKEEREKQISQDTQEREDFVLGDEDNDTLQEAKK